MTVRLRAYKPKTSGPRGALYGSWVTLTEYRADPRLCAVTALAKYLHTTAEYTIARSMQPDSETKITELLDPSGNCPVKAKPLLISLNGSPRFGIRSNTVNGDVRRTICEPLALEHTPHILRATASSYKYAYGVPMHTVLATGDWKDEATFRKYYFRITSVPISKSRLRFIHSHDWIVLRAHQLLRSASLQPLGNPAQPDTRNDQAIALALTKHTRKRKQTNRRG